MARRRNRALAEMINSEFSQQNFEDLYERDVEEGRRKLDRYYDLHYTQQQRKWKHILERPAGFSSHQRRAEPDPE